MINGQSEPRSVKEDFHLFHVFLTVPYRSECHTLVHVHKISFLWKPWCIFLKAKYTNPIFWPVNPHNCRKQNHHKQVRMDSKRFLNRAEKQFRRERIQFYAPTFNYSMFSSFCLFPAPFYHLHYPTVKKNRFSLFFRAF